MTKYIYKNGKQTQDWTPEYHKVVKDCQRELVRVNRLYYYHYNDKTNSIVEIPTKEYQNFKNRWAVAFNKFEDIKNNG